MDLQKRRTHNLMIMNLLYKIVEMYPDLRFGQIIKIFCEKEGNDFFNDEPDVTLQHIKDRIEEWKLGIQTK